MQEPKAAPHHTHSQETNNACALYSTHFLLFIQSQTLIHKVCATHIQGIPSMPHPELQFHGDSKPIKQLVKINDLWISKTKSSGTDWGYQMNAPLHSVSDITESQQTPSSHTFWVH